MKRLITGISAILGVLIIFLLFFVAGKIQDIFDASCTCMDGDGNAMSLLDAIDTAFASECGDNLVIDCLCPQGYNRSGNMCTCSGNECPGPIRCRSTVQCSRTSSTISIDLDLQREGCNPVCVVDLKRNTAKIDWRCSAYIYSQQT